MKFNIYEICGYHGSEHGYDGPEDYNFTMRVGLPDTLSPRQVKIRIDKLTKPYNNCEAVVYEYKVIGTCEMSDI